LSFGATDLANATLLLDQACEALVTAGATVVVAAGNDDEGMGPKPVVI
jgi:hypothetical protein